MSEPGVPLTRHLAEPLLIHGHFYKVEYLSVHFLHHVWLVHLEFQVVHRDLEVCEGNCRFFHLPTVAVGFLGKLFLMVPYILWVFEEVIKVKHIAVLRETQHLMFHVLHALRDELDHIFPLIVEVVTIDKVQEGNKLVAILCHGEGAGRHDSRKDTMEAASAPPDELYDVVGQTEREIAGCSEIFLLQCVIVGSLSLLSLAQVSLDVLALEAFDQLGLIEGKLAASL